MARKKYEATREIRNIGPTQVAEGPNYTGLIQATTARSEAMSSLIGGMKTFTEEKFLADASKRAAKTALDNDPLQVVMATQDSMKTEDKLAASISMKQLQNNVIRSYDAKVKSLIC